jgi:hypothetical protein
MSIFKESVSTLSLLFERLYELNRKWCGNGTLKIKTISARADIMTSTLKMHLNSEMHFRLQVVSYGD